MSDGVALTAMGEFDAFVTITFDRSYTYFDTLTVLVELIALVELTSDCNRRSGFALSTHCTAQGNGASTGE